MKRLSLVIALIVCASTTAIARGKNVSTTPKPIVKRHLVHWGDGEQLVFAAHLAGIEVGYAIVAARVSSRNTLILRGKTKASGPFRIAYPAKEELVTWVKLDDLTPRRSRLVTRKGRRVIETKTRHLGRRVHQHVRYNRRKPYLRRRTLLPMHRDPLSALYALRSGPILARKKRFLVLTGRKTYRISIDSRRKQTLRYQRRSRRVIRLRGTLQRTSDRGAPLAKKRAHRFDLFLTNDPLRLPIYATMSTKLGTVGLRLKHYRRANRPLAIGK
jgi:hypothetical protein